MNLTERQKQNLATIAVLLLFLIMATADSWFNF